MTKIYLIRHCEGMGNVLKIFNGTTDCDITELGAEQLEYLGKRFDGIKVDAVYSSPLKRTEKTANSVAERKGLPLILREDLGELYGGVVEGKPFMEAFSKIPGLAECWNERPQDFAPEGGESMRSGYERIYNAVLDIAKQQEGKTVVIATHGGVLRCLFARLIYGTIDRLKDIPWCDNTDVALVEVENGKCELKFYNDHSHLPESLIPKRSKIGGFVKK